MDQRRQRLLIKSPETKSALIVGAGGIGSTAAVLLARTGIKDIVLYDHDIVEEWNCTGGLFDRNFLGRPKVESVQSLIRITTGLEISIIPKEFSYTPNHYSFVVVGTDSLESRNKVWRANINTDAFIDARIGGHVCEVFTVTNPKTNEEDKEKYEKSLGLKIAPAPCGTEQTAYVIERVCSMIGRSVRAICNGEEPPFWQYADAERDETLITNVANNSESLL